jgi:hypothetical protein
MEATMTTRGIKAEPRVSPKEMENQLQSLKDLQAKVDEAKAKVKEAKEAEKAARDAEKAAKKSTPVFNRMTAMSESLKADPKGKRDDICKAADKLYTDKTGEPANVTKTTRYYKYAIAAMKVFVS